MNIAHKQSVAGCASQSGATTSLRAIIGRICSLPRALDSPTSARFAWFAVALLVLAGCGGGESADSGDADIAIAATDLGEVLVDGDGMTLYVFDPDEGGTSTCFDACADAWPPLTIDGDVSLGSGIDRDLVGTTSRPDGSSQVTYAGWPVYLWIGDGEAGVTSGQGVDDLWWVIAADGTVKRGDAAGDNDSSGVDDEEAPSRDDYY